MKPTLMAAALMSAGILASPPLLADARDLSSCCTPGDKDFPIHGGNLGNQRYSALTQINQANIRKLGPVWRTHVSAVAPATDNTGAQTTPLVVDGVIYLETPVGGVIAVDGATGATKWKWHPPATNDTRRGLAVGDGKVYTLADGNRVVALNKDTGAEVWITQPRGPNGASLGNIEKVGVVYFDGMVYVGTNDGNRGAAFAVRSSDGSDGIGTPGGVVWSFYGTGNHGTLTDVNGKATDVAATWKTPTGEPNNACALTAGATPWIHGSLDPELGMAYYSFGNVRSCGSSQDGSTRPGENLFANSLVAVDLKTGAYKWHYQFIRHDVWDMDNVHPLLLADVPIDGQTRKAIYYGSKSGHLFVLDRTNGKPLLPVNELPMTVDKRQVNWPTQPFPNRFLPHCLTWQALDPKNIPGDPWRAVPNYNGYQPNEKGELVYTEGNYLEADNPFLTIPPEYGATHRKGCMYDTHWDLPVLSTTSQNGGPDWSSYSFSHKRGLIFIPYGVNPVAHWRGAGGNGQRAIGQYQTGGILALDASTNTVRWTNHLGLDMGHGQSPLSTESDLVFVGQFDGNFSALDAVTGKELWRFQTGAAISGGAVTYTINGEQYVAVFTGGTGIPYGNSVTEGDSLWAFKLGGTYKTDSGSSEGPTPRPLTIRRPVSGNTPVEGSTVNNTVYLARQSRTTDTAAARDSVNAAGMNPTHMRVPVGTTVTFLNPGAATFPNFPNAKAHCATQYFEGLFNPKLNPGESFQYKFDRAGEYFFNDCTDPRPTGKVEVYLTPQDVPNALRFTPRTLDLGSPTGLFTDVHGVVTAHFKIPAGYTLDGDVKLKTPLSATLFPAESTDVEDGMLVAHFRKADIDNNIPQGDSVPLVLMANFIHQGQQKQLTSTALVRVTK